MKAILPTLEKRRPGYKPPLPSGNHTPDKPFLPEQDGWLRPGELGAPPAAFEAVFECGIDFHRDLARFGISDNINDLKSRATIERAWRQHGRAFLSTFVPEPGQPSEPWALRTFGPPEEVEG